VIAAPRVAAVDVLRSAHEIAASEAIRPGSVQRRSLFELPLGEGSLWNLTEDEGPTTAPGSREERCEAVLPAWSAASMHDLDDEALGFPAAAFALKEALELDDYGYEARQAAVARYSAVGFEAAAVSALAVKLSARVERSGRRRTAVLRFGHPFAAVAVAIDSLPGSPGDPTHTDWHGLPVFSAWISEPAEPDAESSS
jgi:hypothetical protein